MLTRLGPRRAPSPRPEEAPGLVAFCIVERADGSSTWIRCGRARVNRDGSINVRLDALPLNGELHLRPAETTSPPATAERKPESGEPPSRLNG